MRKAISIVMVLMLLLALAVSANGMSINWPTFRTLDDYEEFIRTHELPEDFAYANDFLSLGHFVWGRVYSLTTQDDSYNYSYEFEDEDGANLLVCVYHGGLYDYSVPRNLAGTMFHGSMRNTQTVGKTAVYGREGARYVYRADGRLDRIQWKQGDVCFEIEARWTLRENGNQESAVLGDYPTGEKQTIMRRLLSCDDEVFRAAFQELTAELDGEVDTAWADNVPIKQFEDEESYHKNLTFTCVTITLALGGVVTVLLIRKKRQAE